MSSYYNRIEGTLHTGRTARSSDIHLIQSGIQDAFQRSLIDLYGTGVILGESENALKLEPTTQHTDQYNIVFDENSPGLSCYETYYRQPIDIEKSSIESIKVDMLNNSKIDVTVYAELADVNLEVISQTNTILPSTNPNEYTTISFDFNEHHLPLGRYYFILKPIDVSAVDLAKNGDETTYDTITPEMFKIKYDNEGTYSNIEDANVVFDREDIGLYFSYDGNDYHEARLLYDDVPDKNFDLYFEQVFSSGNTYLINNGAAIILGEKVYPLDTHVTIDGPSTDGDRTDLVILTTDGRLNVIKGTVYNGEKIYPVDNTGLKIAYITTYKYGLTEEEKELLLKGKSIDISNKKVPSIEQDDESNITRQRDILERLRRLEKKIQYQYTNNSPTRIKYNCEVDPVLAQSNVDKEIIGEGTYGITEGKASDGSVALTTGNSQTCSWAIIENNYSYNYSSTSTIDGVLKITDVHMPIEKPPSIESYMKCVISVEGAGYDKVTKNNPEGYGPVPYSQVQITIKKNSNVIKTYTINTGSNGVYNLSLWNIKNLKTGDYKIYAKYDNKTVQSKMTVYEKNHNFNNVSVKTHPVDVSIKTETAAQSTQELPSNVIAGNDSFYTDKITINETKGEVTVQRVGDTGEYQKNKLLKDVNVFSSSDTIYKLKNSKHELTSEYPVLNFTLTSDTHIKSVTPYIAGFKNIEKFGILIFKNDFVFNKTTNTRKVIQKKVNKVDSIFPTIYDSKWKSLKDLVEQKDGYKTLNKQITFDINKDFDAGTYSLVIYGRVNSQQKEGAIKIKEYVTRDYNKEYGIATKCTGSSEISIINMDTSNLTNKSWDVLIEQKPYKYYDSGVLISKPISVARNIQGCKATKNFEIPNGCKINLYVSNNGGTTWTNANTDENIKFNGNGSSFRWKLEMSSNSVATPKLSYNEKWKYAISFNLLESSNYVPYEDYQKCYETPLLNANAITRSYVGSDLIQHRFSEWEFARLYIEDEELKSKIDILISYADDAYSTVNTNKDNWDKNIFFSQIFADLTLNDFNRNSVDYDNYEGNVEYDEYNYPFKMESEYIMQYTENALAAPDVYYNNSSTPYKYGDISRNGMYDFTYDYVKNTYSYIDNKDDSTKKYAGMHITDGPTWKAVLNTSEPSYTPEDVIIGVSFTDTLEINENITHVTLGIKPVINQSQDDEGFDQSIEDDNTEQLFFPPQTFEVVIAVNQYGEVDDDATNGKTYVIDTKLLANEYNEVTVSFLDDLDGFSASGIGSIGIRVRDTNSLKEGEGLELGRITTSSENRRPYTPYMHTGKWDRLSWQNMMPNSDCRAYAMYILGKRNNSQHEAAERVFYPITNYDKNAVESQITFISNTNDDSDSIKAVYKDADNQQHIVDITSDTINQGKMLYVWDNEGTSKGINELYSSTSSSNVGQIKSVITREGCKIDTKIKNTTYTTKDSGNQTLFYLPKNVTGELFKINTDIPYTIYDLIDIEYYVLTTYTTQAIENGNQDGLDVSTHTDGYTYTTHGHFSKGDIYINFYDTRDTSVDPVESFALPAWGRIQTRSYVKNKIVHSWFKKRSSAINIKAITIERQNPRENEDGENSIPVDDVYLVLNNILFFNAETEAALGPQMQMRIYPNTTNNLSNNTKIRKIGGIYRI